MRPNHPSGRFPRTALAALLLAATAAPEVAAQHSPRQAALAAFEAELAADVASDSVGSIAAAVVVGDDVVWSRAFGWADAERAVPASPETIYRTGSISKSITAVVMMALVERGMIDLDDPVADHLPEIRRLADLPAGAPDITWRDLASHTAGLEREPGLDDAARGRIGQWERKVLASIPATSALRPPGEAYAYSNIGYGILGLALQRAAGRPFMELVRELVFEPLGMTSSYFVVPDSARSRLAAGYVNLDDGTVDPRVPRAEHRGRGYKVPNGGVYSTVGDLARFVMAMTGALAPEEFPGADSRSAMLTDWTPLRPVRTGSGDDDVDDAIRRRSGYGLGFQVREIAGVTMAGHSGSVAGYTAYLVFDPDSRTGVILLRNYNRGSTNLGAAAGRLLLALVEARDAP